MGTPLLWIGFNVFVLGSIALDLGVFNRRLHKVELREAFWSTILWIALSVVFGLGIWYFSGHQRAIEFFTGYLIEKALSVDNLFLFLVIFRTFAIDERFQHRMLEWGILGALVMRGIMIFAGAELIERFSWIMYLFGAFLVYAGIHMLFAKKEKIRPEQSAFFRFANAQLRLTRDYHGERFFVRKEKKIYATPLFLVLAGRRDHRRNSCHRLDSRDFRDHARSLHRLHIERFRDSRPSRALLLISWIFEPFAVPDGGTCLRVVFYRRKNDRGTLAAHRAAHFPAGGRREFSCLRSRLPCCSRTRQKSAV